MITREKHILGVAGYMYENAEQYNLSQEEMYMLGLLHDVGYFRSKEGHEQFGTLYLRNVIGITNQDILWCIGHHGSVPTSFDWDNARSRKLYLLLKADMLISEKGEFLGYEYRLSEAAANYGEDSDEYKRIKGIICWLEEQCR